MRWNWRDLLDWRWVAGAVSLVVVAAGLSWYGGFRPGISSTSLWIGGIVASAALIAVLVGMSKSLVNLAGYIVLVALFGALFVRSQLRRGAFAPPVEEWTVAVGLVGGVIAAIALVRRSQRGSDAGPPSVTRVLSTALVVFVLGASCVCVPGAKIIGDQSSDAESSRGFLRSAPILAEVLPLPFDTELVRTDSFNVGGEQQHVFVIGGTQLIDRVDLVEVIVAHYILQDWPLAPEQIGRRKVYLGCRPVRGLVTWNHHCLEVIINEGTDARPGYPAIPGTVNLYIE